MNRTANHRGCFLHPPTKLDGNSAERRKLMEDAPAIVAAMIRRGLASHQKHGPVREVKGKTK